jgi:hypothetical protein
LQCGASVSCRPICISIGYQRFTKPRVRICDLISESAIRILLQTGFGLSRPPACGFRRTTQVACSACGTPCRNRVTVGRPDLMKAERLEPRIGLSLLTIMKKESTKSSTNWKSNGLVHGMAEAILDTLDALTFVTDDGFLVGSTAEEILHELPTGTTLSQVEEQLEGLKSLGSVGEDQCDCKDCDSRCHCQISFTCSRSQS